MSDEKRHIDDLFTRKIGGMEAMPSSADWQAIQDKMARRKRRRWAIWRWPALGLLLLLIGGGMWWSQQDRTRIKSGNTASESTFSDKPAVHKGEQEDLAFNRNTNSSSEENTLTDPKQPLQPADSADKQDGLLVAPEKDQVILAQGVTPLDQSSPSAAIPLKPKSSRNRSGAKQQPPNSSEEDFRSVSPAESHPDYPDIANAGDSAYHADLEAPLDSTLSDTASDIQQITDTDSTAAADNEIPDSIAKKSSSALPSPTPFSRNGWSIGASFGLQQPGNSFGQDNSLYTQTRTAQDQYGLQPSFGLSLRYDRGPLSLGTGIHYRRMNLSGTYALSRNIYDSIPVLDPGGQVVGYFHTNHRDTSYSFDHQISQRFIELPLLIGGRIALSRRLTLEAHAGAALCFQRSRGIVLDPITFLPAATGEGDFYRETSFALSGSLDVAYRLAPRWSTQLSVQVMQNITPITLPEFPIQIRPWSAGIEAGLRYHIQKPLP